MNLRAAANIVVPLAAAAVFLSITANASASGALDQPGAIRITDRLVRHTHVDGGRHGPGAGDFDFYRQLLYNKGITSIRSGTRTSRASTPGRARGTAVAPTSCRRGRSWSAV